MKIKKTTWLLILFLKVENGTPKYFIKPYENEVQCRYDGGKIESAERLKDNYDVWFNCMERTK